MSPGQRGVCVAGDGGGRVPLGRDKGLVCFSALSFCERPALLPRPLRTPPAQQNGPLFRRTQSKTQTLHSIMAAGVHSDGLSAARRPNRDRRTKQRSLSEEIKAMEREGPHRDDQLFQGGAEYAQSTAGSIL
ncbi:hypothetical protein AAFF_G00264450 [Aldrovandia affinis]|uniref:Uncharacterized protein n=1 Tax=Aldrovandia affinis TaxID=143900 RepID=A0AAD7SU46_9TELE|nr:hypothetical protein AAFF_G00264450 [Aldrovandia affinis]